MEDYKKVLIVEDEEVLSSVLAKKLEQSDCEVWVAQNGEEAMENIDDQEFDVIILDIIMPKKSGFDVLNYLRDVDMDIPVLVLSNLSQQSDIETLEDMGVQKYFVKSNIDLEDVADYVSRMR